MRRQRDSRPLSEQFPKGYAHLKAIGFHNVAAMMTRFNLCADMDRALGAKNAVSKWAKAKAAPYPRWEAIAKAWVEGPGPVAYVEPQRVAVEVVEERHFLLAVPVEKAEKVLKVLSLLGAEAVEL